MTPEFAIKVLRTTIENQGPDTPNRHYGRKQWNYLIECCDTLSAALGDVEEIEVDGGLGMVEVLAALAETPIEDMDNADELSAAWLTADDIASRIRARLQEMKYWWTS